jgi:hypothetical protein
MTRGKRRNEATVKLRYPAVIIMLQTAVIIVLGWAVVYFGRDEFKLLRSRDASEVVSVPRVAEKEGAAVVRISRQAQEASGVVSSPLQKHTLQAETRWYGSVVNLQPLLELRLRYLAALQEANVLRPALARSKAEYQRVRALYRDDRNASERALQSAEAEWKADQARLDAASGQAANVRALVRQQWGEALSAWAVDEQSAQFARFMEQQDVLLQVVAAYDQAPPRKDTPFKLAALGVERSAVDATFVSSSAQADPLLSGRSWYFRAAAANLGAGTRVVVSSASRAEQKAGVMVPAAAVVWHAGKAWIYMQHEADEFMRREVPTQDPVSDGWFVASGFSPGDKVVVSGAQLLLSEEFRYQIKNENVD